MFFSIIKAINFPFYVFNIFSPYQIVFIFMAQTDQSVIGVSSQSTSADVDFVNEFFCGHFSFFALHFSIKTK